MRTKLHKLYIAVYKLKVMQDLRKIAHELRQDVIVMLEEAKSGHSGGSLGTADIFTALFFDILKYNPKKPNWDKRDYFVLSNGHICPIYYATMAKAGFFPRKLLFTLRKIDSKLQGHPHRGSIPGLETSSGPLGCGISQSAGMALGLQLDKKKNRVICMTSDGEHDEGNTWEGVMFAAKRKLHNLTVIMDRNNIQLSGDTKEIMPLKNLRAVYEGFGWVVSEIDGHNFKQIIKAVNKKTKMPHMIIAHTIPGKGVSFMENDWRWHGKAPSKEEAQKALGELDEGM